jgi:hypothetical protein
MGDPMVANARSAEMRHAWAEWKRAVKSRAISREDAVGALDDPALADMRTVDFLMAFPGWGESWAGRAMLTAGVGARTRLRGLTRAQRYVLADYLEGRRR